MPKPPAQLDREIAAALTKRPRHASMRSPLHVPTKLARNTIRSAGGGLKTLRRIATMAFPKYKGRVSIEVDDHVDRRPDDEDEDTFDQDYLIKLSHLPEDRRSLKLVMADSKGFLKQPDVYGNMRTEIPFGSVYVSKHVRRGKDAGVTIYIPPIDQETVDVAVDAALEAGKTTPAVIAMIENALEGRSVMVTGMLLDAYVALVGQLAGTLSSAEGKVRI